MGPVYQCWWMTCREIHVFYAFKYHMCYVLHPFVTYLLTLPRNLTVTKVDICNFKADAKLKYACIVNNGYPSEKLGQSLPNLGYLFKPITKYLHCKQDYDPSPIIIID
jgi:hypothetical protein